MKCPKCGYEPEQKPYKYVGHLREYLPTILKLLRVGRTTGEVASTVRNLHNLGSSYCSTETINYIARRYGLNKPPGDGFEKRNREIAEKYLAGDVTLRALGDEYEMSPERIRQIVIRFERNLHNELRAKRAAFAAERIEDVPLDMLALTVRLANCFRNENLTTVGEVMKLSDSELCSIPHFGTVSLRAWKRCFERLRREIG